MKGKFWRLLLALCLAVLCLTAPLYPAVGAEADAEENPTGIYAFNLTGAGSDDIMNLNTGATYQERETLLETFRFPDMMDIVKFRLNKAA